jgi:hypothetical protein
MRQRTSPAYWPMRILLGIGSAAVAVIVVGGFMMPSPDTISARSVTIGLLSLPGPLLWRVLAVVIPVVGLLWMIGIFRGSRDEPPPWRYRGH